MNRNLICYCFDYSADDIREDLEKNGESTIMLRIVNEKKEGMCRCKSNNPKGR